MENKKVKAVAILMTIALLFSAVAIVASNTVTAESEPDYSYEYELDSDGSDDSNGWYSIERDDDSLGGNINVTAHMDEKEINIELENIREINLYFNETDINLNEFKGYINMFGADITITITSDVNLLDAELHGVPNPDKVEVTTSNWDGYTWEDNVFSFTNMEMSTQTITLSYTSDIVDIIVFALTIYILIWFMQKVVAVVKHTDEVTG